MSLAEMQIVIPLLTVGSILSAAWLVLHARDVVILLRALLPLEPGKGRRLASFKQVCAAITVFGFSVAAEARIIARAAAS